MQRIQFCYEVDAPQYNKCIWIKFNGIVKQIKDTGRPIKSHNTQSDASFLIKWPLPTWSPVFYWFPVSDSEQKIFNLAENIF